MKNIAIFILLGIASACTISNPPAGHGFVYTNTSEIVYYDPYIKPQQKATLCSKNFLGFSTGNSDFTALKLNSGIRKIFTMERTYKSLFSLYSQSCLVVKGE